MLLAYANVGATVHTLFRMNRRPLDGAKKVESNDGLPAADAQSKNIGLVG
jgi:hypothetical protein